MQQKQITGSVITGINEPWVSMYLDFLDGAILNWILLNQLHRCISCQRTDNLHKIEILCMVWMIFLCSVRCNFWLNWCNKSWETCPTSVFEISTIPLKVLNLLSSCSLDLDIEFKVKELSSIVTKVFRCIFLNSPNGSYLLLFVLLLINTVSEI